MKPGPEHAPHGKHPFQAPRPEVGLPTPSGSPVHGGRRRDTGAFVPGAPNIDQTHVSLPIIKAGSIPDGEQHQPDQPSVKPIEDTRQPEPAAGSGGKIPPIDRNPPGSEDIPNADHPPSDETRETFSSLTEALRATATKDERIHISANYVTLDAPFSVLVRATHSTISPKQAGLAQPPYKEASVDVSLVARDDNEFNTLAFSSEGRRPHGIGERETSPDQGALQKHITDFFANPHIPHFEWLYEAWTTAHLPDGEEFHNAVAALVETSPTGVESINIYQLDESFQTGIFVRATWFEGGLYGSYLELHIYDMVKDQGLEYSKSTTYSPTATNIDESLTVTNRLWFEPPPSSEELARRREAGVDRLTERKLSALNNELRDGLASGFTIRKPERNNLE